MSWLVAFLWANRPRTLSLSEPCRVQPELRQKYEYVTGRLGFRAYSTQAANAFRRSDPEKARPLVPEPIACASQANGKLIGNGEKLTAYHRQDAVNPGVAKDGSRSTQVPNPFASGCPNRLMNHICRRQGKRLACHRRHCTSLIVQDVTRKLAEGKSSCTVSECVFSGEVFPNHTRAHCQRYCAGIGMAEASLGM